MNDPLPRFYLARHGETEWTLSRQHTGLTDIPLTSRGERDADRLGERLRDHTFAQVFTSPLQRAKRTCEIAGYSAVAVVDADLVEWDYGDYEGKKTIDIRKERPGWVLFRDGCPNGESVAEIGVARTVSSPGFARSTGTSYCFPVDIFCAFSLHAGSDWRPLRAGSFT